MLQSLAMKEYDSSTFESFGFTIIDETHHISSKVFSKALFNICTKYMLGLSATPIRKDGLTKVLNWFIGDIFYCIQRENQSSVTVQVIPFSCDEYKVDPPLNKLGKIALSQVINIVTSIHLRNSKILELIQSNLLLGRKIILLTDRRQHCEDLNDLFISFNLSFTSGLYMGGMKQCVLKENESCNVIFATFSLAHEGLDIPSLDTLILASPKTDIVQSCGRILRETIGKKNNPLIIDFNDKFASLPNQFRKRKIYYKEAGFYISSNNATNKEPSIQSYSFIDE